MFSLSTIQRFKMAQAIPVDGTATFAEVAKKCSLSEDRTRRLLRHAMTFYYFQEPAEGVVAHTAPSRVMVDIPPADQMLGFLGTEMFPGCLRIPDALEKWPMSEEPNECGWALANNTNLKAYDIIDTTPWRAKQMADAMSFQQAGEMFSHKYLLESYDWQSISNGLLVDIGGSYGEAAKEIARHVPKIKCIVQDLPEVISKAEIPPDLSTRLTYMQHDFFNEQPVKGADVYMFRWILHNWSDKYAAEILRNLIPALKPGSRVLVSEICLPAYDNSASLFKSRPARYVSDLRSVSRASKVREIINTSCRHLDVFMMQLQNSKERDEKDWRHLFELASPRFCFRGTRNPPVFGMSIIEAVWE